MTRKWLGLLYFVLIPVALLVKAADWILLGEVYDDEFYGLGSFKGE